MYTDKAESLVKKAEETLNISDYTNAMNYMPNVKDENKRASYEERLAAVKTQIDEAREALLVAAYDKVNYGAFKWTYYGENSGPVRNYTSQKTNPYAVWAPESVGDLNGVSLPLMIWLHS